MDNGEKAGKHLLMVMDVNENAMDGPMRSMVEDEGVQLLVLEFSYKYW